MITIETPTAARELLALMLELQAEGLDEDSAFIVACQELPALLAESPEAVYVPRKVVLFDEGGMPTAAFVG